MRANASMRRDCEYCAMRVSSLPRTPRRDHPMLMKSAIVLWMLTVGSSRAGLGGAGLKPSHRRNRRSVQELLRKVNRLLCLRAEGMEAGTP